MLWTSSRPENVSNTQLNIITTINSHRKLRKISKRYLDYCATHPSAEVRFHASDRILAMHSDCSYLSELESKSRASGHFYLSKRNNEKFNNGAVLTLSKIIKHIIISAS